MFVAETTEEARAVGRAYLFEKHRRYLEWGQGTAIEDVDALNCLFDRLERDRFLLVPPDEVADRSTISGGASTRATSSCG